MQRIEALQNVKTYILEAGNNEDVSTITVEDPVKEIVAVHEAMQHRLREQHSQVRGGAASAHTILHAVHV